MKKFQSRMDPILSPLIGQVPPTRLYVMMNAISDLLKSCDVKFTGPPT